MWMFRSLILLILICLQQQSFGIQDHWMKELGTKKQFESSPPAFEKIYFKKNQLLSMPDGNYIKLPCGNLEKAQTIFQDDDGLYVLVIEHQCPLCGAIYKGANLPDDACCPLYEIEVKPHIWIKP